MMFLTQKHQHPAFRGKSESSLCRLKSWNLSFPVIVHGIIFVFGWKSGDIQLLQQNILIPCFQETFLNHRLYFSPPFPHVKRQYFTGYTGEVLTWVFSQLVSKTPEGQSCKVSKYEEISLPVISYLLGLISKLTCSACSGMYEKSARGDGSTLASWFQSVVTLRSVVTHNGATSRPQQASTSRAMPLFKNVFVLLFCVKQKRTNGKRIILSPSAIPTYPTNTSLSLSVSTHSLAVHISLEMLMMSPLCILMQGLSTLFPFIHIQMCSYCLFALRPFKMPFWNMPFDKHIIGQVPAVIRALFNVSKLESEWGAPGPPVIRSPLPSPLDIYRAAGDRPVFARTTQSPA